MANVIRIKRRASGGGTGAPSTLENAELAFNEADDVLYYGKGTGGAGGSATTVEAIGGPGAMVTRTTTQTVSGDKTFTGVVNLSSATVTLPTSGVSAGTYTKVTVNTQGIVTGSGSLLAGDMPDLSGTYEAAGALSTHEGTYDHTLLHDPLTLAVNAQSIMTLTGQALSFDTQTQNKVLAAPTGSTAAPTFRQLDASDIPTLTAAKISDFDTQVRTNRLDQMAVPTAAVSFNGQNITGLATPNNDADAATKAYVDANATGFDIHDPVVAATTANITLSGSQTIDGVSPNASDRILVKDQTNSSENGVYLYNGSGAWSRATDADATGEIEDGFYVFVEGGNTNNASSWVVQTGDTNIVVGTDPISFVQFSSAAEYSAGAGLTKSGSTFNVVTADVGRIVVNADSIDLASGIATPGTYKSLTVDTYGRVTGGTNPTTLAGYGITDAQGLDATLTALAGLTTSADQLIYATGSDTFSVASLTNFGRTLVANADASAARTDLELGSIATQDANSVAITGGTIDGITIDGGTF